MRGRGESGAAGSGIHVLFLLDCGVHDGARGPVCPAVHRILLVGRRGKSE